MWKVLLVFLRNTISLKPNAYFQYINGYALSYPYAPLGLLLSVVTKVTKNTLLYGAQENEIGFLEGISIIAL